MKKLVLSLILSILFIIGLTVSVQAGDFVIALDYQDLTSELDVGGLADLESTGNFYSLDGQYYFTPQFSLELAYTRGSFDYDLLGLAGIDYDSNTYAVQLNYLFPISDKFSIGGFAGYKSYKLSGDGWIDIPCLIIPRQRGVETVSAVEPGGDEEKDTCDRFQGGIDNLYSIKMNGFLLGIKAVYKPTDQFTLESTFGEIVNPGLDLDLAEIGGVPDQYLDDPYYYQFDITGSYWITPSFALRAGYSLIKTGFNVSFCDSRIDFDRKYDGLHVGVAWKF